MNPARVVRACVRELTDLPNIGKAMAGDLRRLGIREPAQLKGKSPFELYDRLCRLTGQRQDPCVLDVFMSITAFMNGKSPRPWWDFTAARKRALARAAKP